MQKQYTKQAYQIAKFFISHNFSVSKCYSRKFLNNKFRKEKEIHAYYISGYGYRMVLIERYDAISEKIFLALLCDYKDLWDKMGNCYIEWDCFNFLQQDLIKCIQCLIETLNYKEYSDSLNRRFYNIELKSESEINSYMQKLQKAHSNYIQGLNV